MKLKVINATFPKSTRVSTTNRVETFVSAEAHRVNLDYYPEFQLLHISAPGKPTSLIGLSNIENMTLAEGEELEPTTGHNSGTKTKK